MRCWIFDVLALYLLLFTLLSILHFMVFNVFIKIFTLAYK